MTATETHKTKSLGFIWLIPLALILFILLSSLTAVPTISTAWLGIASGTAVWNLTRASGIVGYFLLAASTIWGLLLSTKMIKNIVPPAIALAMHNYLSWTAIGFSILHAGLLLFDGYYNFQLWNLLIPFTGPYAPFWVGIGILGFYLMGLTTLSFYARKKIGQKNWRKLHYLTFLAFAFITAHGWMAGTDSVQLSVMYGVSTLSVFFLTTYRILTAVTGKK